MKLKQKQTQKYKNTGEEPVAEQGGLRQTKDSYPSEKNIQDKFVLLKKAEQDFIELLKKVEDEDKLINIMTRLKTIDEGFHNDFKQPTRLPSYVG
jgi:hypothetical protein